MTNEATTRSPRSLRKRIGDLEPTSDVITVRGEKREVARPGSGSLGSAKSSLTSVIDNCGDIGDVALLKQALANVEAYFVSVKDKLDEIPESRYESRKLSVGDEVLPSKNATDKMKERFGAEPRKITEIHEDDGLVTVEGYGILPRISVVELSMAKMIAGRKPRGSGNDSDE